MFHAHGHRRTFLYGWLGNSPPGARSLTFPNRPIMPLSTAPASAPRVVVSPLAAIHRNPPLTFLNNLPLIVALQLSKLLPIRLTTSPHPPARRTVMRNLLIEAPSAKPAPRQMHAQFLDQLALTGDAIQVADQEDAQPKLVERNSSKRNTNNLSNSLHRRTLGRPRAYRKHGHWMLTLRAFNKRQWLATGRRIGYVDQPREEPSAFSCDLSTHVCPAVRW